MKAKKIYESLKDFGFSDDDIVRFIRSHYGNNITLELEHERNSWEDYTDDIFRSFGNDVEKEASRSQIEDFDIGHSRFFTFTISGTVENVIDALNNAGWLWANEDPAEFIKDHIIIK